MSKLVIFGDSIAHGGPDGGWPIRIRQRLHQAGLGDHVYVQAVAGDTSYDLVRRMPVELPLRSGETVLIAIGTNDSQDLLDRDHPRVTDAEFRQNLSACIESAKRHARWVVVLEPYGIVPRMDGQTSLRAVRLERLARIREITQEVTAMYGCWGIQFSNLLEAQHFGPDGVHPNPSGHDLIASIVWQGLRASGSLGWPEDVPEWEDVGPDTSVS